MERNHRYHGPLSNQGRVIAKRLGRYVFHDCQLPVWGLSFDMRNRDEHLPAKLGFSPFRDVWGSTKRREALDKMEDMHSRMEFQEQETQNHYAVVENILETPRLQLSYYWDIPGDWFYCVFVHGKLKYLCYNTGTVPILGVKDEIKGNIHPEIGNGDLSPQFGMDVVVHGGIIRYGPWADRQRFVHLASINTNLTFFL